MGEARLDRTALRTSRLMEFCSRKELVAQTGHPETSWPIVAIKELVDNALDASEDIGGAPVVTVVVDVDNGKIVVKDEGPGIPASVVEAALDFTSRVSTREAYVAPDRGAQGNALKTLLAMPFALSGDEGRTIIRARGVEHDIRFTVDAIRQEPVISYEARVSNVKSGTEFVMLWPLSASSLLSSAHHDFLHLVDGFRAFNPHLSLTVEWREDGYAPGGTYSPSDSDWLKWLPSNPTSAHWYKPEHFRRLVAGYIAHDQDRDATRTVREMVAEFKGMSGSAKQARVLADAGLKGAPLSSLATDRDIDTETADALLSAIQEHTKPVKPSALGVIGKEHVSAVLEAHGASPETIAYKKIEGEADGTPWVIEAAFGYCDDPEAERVLLTGVNWSPGIGNPFRHLGYSGLDGILASYWAHGDEPVVLFFHLACARVEFHDRGKTSVTVPDLDAMREAVDAVLKKWAKQRKAEEKRADAADARNEKLRRQMDRTISIKDAAYEVMEQAYLAASDNGRLPAMARQVMYQARPQIQAMTGGKKLDDQYFTQTLLPDYMKEFGVEDEWNVAFDARGHFHEPFTGKSVALGTLDVRSYLGEVGDFIEPSFHVPCPDIREDRVPTLGPRNRYGAVLFIEKEGFFPLFEQVGLAKRFDIALMSSKGMSSTAARQLVDRLCFDHGIPLFALHDFDKAGLSIAGTLQRNTRRYEFRNDIRVVDLGLRLADVEAIGGLEAESSGLKAKEHGAARRNMMENGASPEEAEILLTKRVELNALTSRQLVEMIEAKLTEHGVHKVVPDNETLAAMYRRAVVQEEAQQAIDKALEQFDASGARACDVPADLSARIHDLLAKNDTRSWDAALRDVVRGEMRRG